MKPPLKLPEGIKEMPSPEPWRLLALSGGGYRGLFSAAALVRLEQAIGSELLQRIGVFAGTSVGGLIAAGLALGRSPADIRDALLRYGPAIFDDRVRVKSFTIYRKPKGHLGALFRAKFDAGALELAIDEILGDQKNIRLAEVPRPLILVATCATTRAPFLMSTFRPGTPGAELPLRTALRATSAAPGYFPAVDLNLRSLVDGGLVANAPELAACAELADARRVPLSDMRVLSIGTAAPESGVVPARVGARGLGKWMAGDLVPMTLDAQEKLATAQAAALHGDRYLRINAVPSAAQGEILALDRATEDATRTLLLLAEQATSPSMAQKVRDLLGIK